MQKKLITLAALLATSGAMAQSSVTLYGVADVGVGKNKYLGDPKVRMQSSSLLNTSDSYLGFRGVEDLGGGLKVGFNFEQAINLRDGSTDERNPYRYTSTMWQRAANLWVGGNWGTFRLGRAFTPSRNAVATWDVMGGANNSVVAWAYNRVGGNTDDRNSSQFSYKTPDLSGFSAEIGYVLKADNNDRSKVDLGLTYVNGPLRAGLAYNKTKNLKANYALGAQYSFGAFMVGAGYYNARNFVMHDNGVVVPNAAGRINGFSLGGRVNFGAASVALDVARDTKSDYVLNGVTEKVKKHTNAVLEGRYSFSKRTFAYASYMRFAGTNNYIVGLRHDF